MLTLLAQAAVDATTTTTTSTSSEAAEASQGVFTNLFETVVSVFSRLDALAQPQVLVQQLQALSIVWAVVFLIIGTLCLFNGYKFYKVATIIMALLMGMFSGYFLGQKIQAPYIVAGCLGLLLAFGVFPLMKYAVAGMGGIVGAFIGSNLWAGLAHALNETTESANAAADAYWVGALLGLLICGMLAFILFELAIILFTSVSGSTVAVLGALALLLSFEPWQDSVARGLTANQMVIPLLVAVPAVVGLILQEAWKVDTTKTAKASSK